MKRSSGTNSISGAGLIALFFFVLHGVGFAGLAVSPLQQRVEVKPGRKATFSIVLTNNNRGPQTISCPVILDVLDF